MQLGLIGLQFSGKSTLFDTLSHSSGDESHLKKGEIRRTVVKVPDIRLDRLTKIFNPQKQVNAAIEIIDVPGLRVADDGKVKITAEFLSIVRNCDALIHVVRQFKDDSIPHPEGNINPIRDIDFLETEFLLSDMTLIENRLEKIEKDLLKSKNEQMQRELPVFIKLQEKIQEEIPLRNIQLDDSEKRTLSGYQFLTIKPMIAAINFDEDSSGKVDGILSEISKNYSSALLKIIPFFAKFEFELSQLTQEEAVPFMQDIGIKESALEKILRTSYELLGLHSFFTVGEDECRAWTIKKNMNAQDAAGVIHTDFYSKFIRAEVVHYDDFVSYGSFAKCKEAGVWRLEGKEYIVKDGDIMNIRHN